MYYFIKRFIGKIFESNESGIAFVAQVFPYEVSKFRKFFNAEDLMKDDENL